MSELSDLTLLLKYLKLDSVDALTKMLQGLPFLTNETELLRDQLLHKLEIGDFTELSDTYFKLTDAISSKVSIDTKQLAIENDCLLGSTFISSLNMDYNVLFANSASFADIRVCEDLCDEDLIHYECEHTDLVSLFIHNPVYVDNFTRTIHVQKPLVLLCASKGINIFDTVYYKRTIDAIVNNFYTNSERERFKKLIFGI